MHGLLSTCISYRVTSRHHPYFVQDRQDATTNNSHCFTRRYQVRPQCGFISRRPYTLQHLYYNYSTTVLLQFSCNYPTSIPLLSSTQRSYIHITIINKLILSKFNMLRCDYWVSLMDTYKINVRPDIKRNCILRTCIRLMFDQILSLIIYEVHTCLDSLNEHV